MDAFTEHGLFGALLLAGVVLGTAPVLIPLFIAPRSSTEKAGETYECGMETIGSAWIRFDIAFYLFALIFLVFSVDILYLLPVALVYDDGTYVWRDLIEMFLFVGILALALVYAWRNGVFDSPPLEKLPVKSEPAIPTPGASNEN